MKICQYCGNRINETDTECPVCHRPIQEDFVIPKHPENRPLWKKLLMFTIAFTVILLFATVWELVTAGFTTTVISRIVLTLIMAGVSALLAFFYQRSV